MKVAVFFCAGLASATLFQNAIAEEMQPICQVGIALSDLNKQQGNFSDANICEVTELTIFDKQNRSVLTVTDRYVSIYDAIPSGFPYTVISSSSGGSGCCTHYYFVDQEGISTKMPNVSYLTRIERSQDAYVIFSASRTLMLPSNLPEKFRKSSN
jgi:hypothetical protein